MLDGQGFYNLRVMAKPSAARLSDSVGEGVPPISRNGGSAHSRVISCENQVSKLVRMIRDARLPVVVFRMPAEVSAHEARASSGSKLGHARIV